MQCKISVAILITLIWFILIFHCTKMQLQWYTYVVCIIWRNIGLIQKISDGLIWLELTGEPFSSIVCCFFLTWRSTHFHTIEIQGYMLMFDRNIRIAYSKYKPKFHWEFVQDLNLILSGFPKAKWLRFALLQKMYGQNLVSLEWQRCVTHTHKRYPKNERWFCRVLNHIWAPQCLVPIFKKGIISFPLYNY